MQLPGSCSILLSLWERRSEVTRWILLHMILETISTTVGAALSCYSQIPSAQSHWHKAGDVRGNGASAWSITGRPQGRPRPGSRKAGRPGAEGRSACSHSTRSVAAAPFFYFPALVPADEGREGLPRRDAVRISAHAWKALKRKPSTHMWEVIPYFYSWPTEWPRPPLTMRACTEQLWLLLLF